MTTTDACTTISFTVSDHTAMEREINAAIEALRISGIQYRKGILVTRHTHDSFSVELHDSVPAGTTHENWGW